MGIDVLVEIISLTYFHTLLRAIYPGAGDGFANTR